MITNERAIEAVTDLARELGLHVTPRVIADRSNLVLRLEPRPLVARVAMATSTARVGLDWLRREVELARFLAGHPVTRLAEELDAGPHEREGLVISFWALEELLERPADPLEAGRALAACHRALVAYPRERLPWLGGWEEARAVRSRAAARFSSDERARIDRAWDEAEAVLEGAESRTASWQPVHGDAHLGNVLGTARGALWTDWEDAFVGPVEYDLACLRSRAELFGEERERIEAACVGYGEDVDPELVRELGLVRNLQVIVWLAVFAERQPELWPRARARIERLPP